MPPAVEYLEPGPLPRGLDSRSLRRRALQIAVVLVIVGVVAALAPGLGDVRRRLEGAQPGWLGVAIVLELLSCLSYVLMFRPIFCARMSRRTSYRLGVSELAVGSLVPASGAAGLAFGAWALRKRGMPVQEIARRTVAFFVRQERSELLRRSGRRDRDVAWSRAARLAGAHVAPGRRCHHGDRRRLADPIRPSASRLDESHCCRARRWDRRRRAPSGASRLARHRRLGRLLGLRQRRPVGVPSRVWRNASAHARPDGLPDRPARWAVTNPGRPRRHRRWPARRGRRLRPPGGGSGSRDPRLPPDPVLAPAHPRWRSVRLAAQRSAALRSSALASPSPHPQVAL